MSTQFRVSLAVGLGSALGAMSRYAVSLLILALPGQHPFPWASLLVNTLGSLLIGLYATLSAPDGPLKTSHAQRQFVITGFCGGFTSFSIFSLETLHLIQQGMVWLAGLNIIASLILWLLAVWLGWYLAIRLFYRS
ncbi:fluoride efflux transporter CrcB [Thiorhodospira sibirica]|uniref:fluoride efflux transporter CrcB n=1 Tax=Thiorhodospira sibirica TaxID=154347 RepID=UPI00022C5DB2|nr:fluoride efflux transporter CrcB [Thiorhodospira sibirica]